MEEIVVIGAGTMGHSIALTIAWSHLNVTIYGINKEEIKNDKKEIKEKIDVIKANQMIDERDMEEIIQRIQFTTEIYSVRDATFIIEAAPENLNLKQELYKQFEKYCSSDTIFASN